MESYIAVTKYSGRASWRLTPLLLVIALFLIPTHMLAEEPHHRIKNIIVVYQENWSFDSL
jgi:phospholipase C